MIVIHYNNKQFKHTIPTHPSTWNHDTFLNLTGAIQVNYNLTETFSLYERIGDEQLIIDDIDDIIAVFESDENQDEKSKNDKIAHIYIKDNDTIERENWKVNSFCMIYSRSKQQWFQGKIINIYGKLEDEYLVVKYNNKSTKEIQRNSKDLKPISLNSALSLRIGSKCLILSEYSHIWYEGKVISILNDNEGEWLAILYKENDLDKIADIQRYSKQLKLYNIENYNKYIVNQHAKKEQKEQQHDTMLARIKALKRMNDEDRNNQIKCLLTVPTASPSDSPTDSPSSDSTEIRTIVTTGNYNDFVQYAADNMISLSDAGYQMIQIIFDNAGNSDDLPNLIISVINTFPGSIGITYEATGSRAALDEMDNTIDNVIENGVPITIGSLTVRAESVITGIPPTISPSESPTRGDDSDDNVSSSDSIESDDSLDIFIAKKTLDLTDKHNVEGNDEHMKQIDLKISFVNGDIFTYIWCMIILVLVISVMVGCVIRYRNV